MADDESVRDKKIQATISSEVKEQVRTLVKEKGFESESEFLRTAVSAYITQQTTPAVKAEPIIEAPLPLTALPQPQTDHLHRDLKERVDLIAWMMTVGLVLMSSVGARLLRAMGEHDANSMNLLDDSLETAAQHREALKHKLGLNWRAFTRAGHVNGAHSDYHQDA